MKDPKGSGHVLVSIRNLSQKMASWLCAQGQANLVKMANTSPIMTSVTENSNLKTKRLFFQSKLSNLPNLCRIQTAL